jgi:hypothetical protein
MRLPQSIVQYPSVRKIHFLTVASVILLFEIMAVSAGATASQLVCVPADLRFGAVLVGQAESLPVAVTNNGQTSVTISAITVGNSEFTVSPVSLPLVLLAGQSLDLSISFIPTAAGRAAGAIKFSSNAPGATILQVSGSGTESESVTASPSTVSFGQVAIGSTVTVPVILTNAHSWKVTLSSLQATGSGFSMNGLNFPLTLGAGQSVSLNAVFAPKSAGSDGGSLFVSGPGLSIPLNGTAVSAGQLTANPASLAFGSVQAGGNLTLTDSLTNTGGSSVTISQATVAGAGFSLSGLTPPLALNPGSSVTFSVLFAPQSAGSANGGITVSSNGSDSSLNISLSGTGTAQGQLTLAPATVNFGNVTVGTSLSQISSFTASGSSVTVSSASLSGSEFALTGVSFPITIAAGQSVPATLIFAPQSSGGASAVLSVLSNAGNSPTETLSGVGVAPEQHSVSLSWTDSGSGVAGYNVYRGGVSGGPYAKINSALGPTPAYSDNSVVLGQTYYYVTTAVNESGEESGYSNETQAVIPAS